MNYKVGDKVIVTSSADSLISEVRHLSGQIVTIAYIYDTRSNRYKIKEDDMKYRWLDSQFRPAYLEDKPLASKKKLNIKQLFD